MTTSEFAGKVSASGALLVRVPLRYERRFRLRGVSENAPTDGATDRGMLTGEVSLEPNAPNEGHMYLLIQPSWDGHTYASPALPSIAPTDGAGAAGPRAATQADTQPTSRRAYSAPSISGVVRDATFPGPV